MRFCILKSRTDSLASLLDTPDRHFDNIRNQAAQGIRQSRRKKDYDRRCKTPRQCEKSDLVVTRDFENTHPVSVKK